MNRGGDNYTQKRDALRVFIDDQFDGNGVAALNELRNYLMATAPRFSEARSSIASPLPAVKEPTGPVLLSVNNLTKTYKRGKQRINVLDDISFNIHQGEIIAITGASGSGKSTLLQLLGGLDKPTSGEVRFGDKDIAKLSDGKLSEFRRQTIGFVFQFFYLQPFLRLERNLEVPGMFAGAKRKGRVARTAELAQQVGLGDRLKHFPKELSGGQMQRAAIARALFNQPKILLADEPTGNLDSENGLAIVELFETIRDTLGTTIVIVTHDQAIAHRADREIRLKDGVLV